MVKGSKYWTVTRSRCVSGVFDLEARVNCACWCHAYFLKTAGLLGNGRVMRDAGVHSCDEGGFSVDRFTVSDLACGNFSFVRITVGTNSFRLALMVSTRVARISPWCQRRTRCWRRSLGEICPLFCIGPECVPFDEVY